MTYIYTHLEVEDRQQWLGHHVIEAFEHLGQLGLYAVQSAVLHLGVQVVG